MIQVSSAYTSSKNYPSIYAKENLSVINENKKTDFDIPQRQGLYAKGLQLCFGQTHRV